MRAHEFEPSKLVIFDIDDTLVHTQTKVHVIRDGQVIKSLNSHDFTHYKLQPGESFDFGDFADAREFFEKSKPIIPMINQLKSDIATGNKVVMVTARADFDDKELFLDTFRKYGIDMSRVHVYRAGNMQGKMQTEEKKKIIIRNLLNQGNYSKAIMYDDAVPNLDSFMSLKKEYPETKFYAWHVSLAGEASEFGRTNENFAEEFTNYQGLRPPKNVFGTNLFSGQDIVGQRVYHCTNRLEAIKKSGGLKPRRDATGEREYGRLSTDEHPFIPVIGIWFSVGKPDWPGKHCVSFVIEPTDQVYVAYASIKGLKPNVVLNPIALDRLTIEGQQDVKENFADGKNPEDKGDSKRYHVPTKGSVSSLRKFAKSHSGRAAQLAHWAANMKAGRAKKNK